MALWIQNITPDDHPEGDPEQYAVRINQNAPLAHFTHNRSLGAAQCLRDAADAIDEANKNAPSR